MAGERIGFQQAVYGREITCVVQGGFSEGFDAVVIQLVNPVGHNGNRIRCLIFCKRLETDAGVSLNLYQDESYFLDGREAEEGIRGAYRLNCSDIYEAILQVKEIFPEILVEVDFHDRLKRREITDRLLREMKNEISLAALF